jgi:hypothetical protein
VNQALRDERRRAAAASLADALEEGDPTVVARAHHADEGYLYLDAIEMTDEEIGYACNKVEGILVARWPSAASTRV